MNNFFLRRGVEELGFCLLPETEERFFHYCRLLRIKNKQLNLVSKADKREIFFHMIDSLSLLTCFSPKFAGKLIDLGAGAGFPGLPLKILRPDLNVTFLDSRHKKLDFVAEVADALKIKDVFFAWGRAEDLAHDPSFRQKFDLVSARAVAALPVLAELSLPFLKTGGTLVAYKGPKALEEIASAAGALKICGGRLRQRCSLYIGDKRREILLIEKTTMTPSRLPRKAGIPQKRSLGARCFGC